LNGQLSLRVGLDNGRTRLLEAHCQFPLQVLRPYHSAADDWLSLVVLTPSGGLLNGDELRAEIIVERGASLELRTQAATQLHAGRSCQTWSVSVEDRASLSYVPHALVPHASATHHTTLSAVMAGSARLLLTEIIAPGRVHRGELFAYDELRSNLDLWRDGTLLARERQILRPGKAHSKQSVQTLCSARPCGSLGQAGDEPSRWTAGIRDCPTSRSMLRAQLGPCSHFASVYLLGPDATAFDAPAFRIGTNVELGVSELARGGACVRLLGQRAFDLERAIAAVHDHWCQSSRTLA